MSFKKFILNELPLFKLDIKFYIIQRGLKNSYNNNNIIIKILILEYKLYSFIIATSCGAFSHFGLFIHL